MFFYPIIIFFCELVLSYTCDMTTIKVVSRKKWAAVTYDVISQICSYAILALIIINNWPVHYIVAAVAGNGLGTFIVASRKPKRKKVVRKKPIFTTA